MSKLVGDRVGKPTVGMSRVEDDEPVIGDQYRSSGEELRRSTTVSCWIDAGAAPSATRSVMGTDGNSVLVGELSRVEPIVGYKIEFCTDCNCKAISLCRESPPYHRVGTSATDSLFSETHGRLENVVDRCDRVGIEILVSTEQAGDRLSRDPWRWKSPALSAPPRMNCSAGSPSHWTSATKLSTSGRLPWAIRLRVDGPTPASCASCRHERPALLAFRIEREIERANVESVLSHGRLLLLLVRYTVRRPVQHLRTIASLGHCTGFATDAPPTRPRRVGQGVKWRAQEKPPRPGAMSDAREPCGSRGPRGLRRLEGEHPFRGSGQAAWSGQPSPDPAGEHTSTRTRTTTWSSSVPPAAPPSTRRSERRRGEGSDADVAAYVRAVQRRRYRRRGERAARLAARTGASRSTARRRRPTTS